MEIEDLERRKRELKLRQEIAQLELRERLSKALTPFKLIKFFWFSSLFLGGSFFVFAGIHDGYWPIVLAGVVALFFSLPGLRLAFNWIVSQRQLDKQ
jgi:hypothetical protein